LHLAVSSPKMFAYIASVLYLAAMAWSAPLDSVTANTITNYTLNGSGCAPGTVTSSVQGNTITASFSQFTTEVGNGVDDSQGRKNCQASIQVQGVPGYQYYPAGDVYSGSLDFQSQVTGTRESTYYFQGQLQQETAQTSASGPISASDVTVEDSFTGNGPLSPCGVSSIVNINLAVALDNGSTKNSGTSTTHQAKFANLVWQKC